MKNNRVLNLEVLNFLNLISFVQMFLLPKFNTITISENQVVYN